MNSAITPGDAAVMNTSVAPEPSAAARRFAMSRSTCVWSRYATGPVHDGLLTADAMSR